MRKKYEIKKHHHSRYGIARIHGMQRHKATTNGIINIKRKDSYGKRRQGIGSVLLACKIVADYITELTGAEQFEIVTHKYDGMAYNPLIKLAQEEAKNGELPEYEGDVDLTPYDTVFIGGPVWWGTYPQVMFTFFKKHANDLKGKTVIPFTTHEGSGLANCVEDVKDAFPGANVQKGFSIYGHEVRTEKAKVEKWINGLK